MILTITACMFVTLILFKGGYLKRYRSPYYETKCILVQFEGAEKIRKNVCT